VRKSVLSTPRKYTMLPEASFIYIPSVCSWDADATTPTSPEVGIDKLLEKTAKEVDIDPISISDSRMTQDSKRSIFFNASPFE
jgi:hypothetical protein